MPPTPKHSHTDLPATEHFPPAGWPQPAPRNFAGRFITLTPLNLETDVDELFRGSHEASTVEAMWRYVAAGPFADVPALRAWLRERQAQPDMIPYTVTDNATGRRIGSISLMRITPAHGVAELGIIWFQPDAQRTLANTEANYLLLRHCFADLGYRRMEWKCHAGNERSKRAALRLGYRYEGTFRQHMITKGRNRDTAWFAMLDHEWPGIAAAMERWLYTDNSGPLDSGETTKPHLRLATPADLPALGELIPQSVRALSGDCYDAAQIESAIRHAFGVDTQLIADGTFFVAEMEGKVVGCGGWSWRRKIYGGDQVPVADETPLNPANEAARTRAFFVHPAWARCGVGSAIMRACARAAGAAGFRRLELLGTLPGERLYRAFGFEVLEYADYTLPDGVVVRWVRMARDFQPEDFG